MATPSPMPVLPRLLPFQKDLDQGIFIQRLPGVYDSPRQFFKSPFFISCLQVRYDIFFVQYFR